MSHPYTTTPARQPQHPAPALTPATTAASASSPETPPAAGTSPVAEKAAGKPKSTLFEDDEYRLKCSDCDPPQYFHSAGMRQNHRNKEHVDVTIVKVPTGITYRVSRTNGLFVCASCNGKSSSSEYLKNHLQGKKASHSCKWLDKWPFDLPENWVERIDYTPPATPASASGAPSRVNSDSAAVPSSAHASSSPAAAMSKGSAARTPLQPLSYFSAGAPSDGAPQTLAHATYPYPTYPRVPSVPAPGQPTSPVASMRGRPPFATPQGRPIPPPPQGQASTSAVRRTSGGVVVGSRPSPALGETEASKLMFEFRGAFGNGATLTSPHPPMHFYPGGALNPEHLRMPAPPGSEGASFSTSPTVVKPTSAEQGSRPPAGWLPVGHVRTVNLAYAPFPQPSVGRPLVTAAGRLEQQQPYDSSASSNFTSNFPPLLHPRTGMSTGADGLPAGLTDAQIAHILTAAGGGQRPATMVGGLGEAGRAQSMPAVHLSSLSVRPGPEQAQVDGGYRAREAAFGSAAATESEAGGAAAQKRTEVQLADAKPTPAAIVGGRHDGDLLDDAVEPWAPSPSAPSMVVDDQPSESLVADAPQQQDPPADAAAVRAEVADMLNGPWEPPVSPSSVAANATDSVAPVEDLELVSGALSPREASAEAGGARSDRAHRSASGTTEADPHAPADHPAAPVPAPSSPTAHEPALSSSWTHARLSVRPGDEDSVDQAVWVTDNASQIPGALEAQQQKQQQAPEEEEEVALPAADGSSVVEPAVAVGTLIDTSDNGEQGAAKSADQGEEDELDEPMVVEDNEAEV